MPPLLMMDDGDLERSLAGTVDWVTDPTGTIRNFKGTAFSENSGVKVENQDHTLEPKDIQLDEGNIGAGACGQVKKGKLKATGTPIAVKTIKIDDKEKKKQLATELNHLVKAEKCPQLVTWYGAFVTRSIVHVVLELMDLGSLRSLSSREKLVSNGNVPTEHLALISWSSVKGLSFLHRNQIVHRDIKPENILHNSIGEVKITDFGISRDLDNTMMMVGTQIGTQIYMAPEMCLGADYNFAVDLWSYGLVLYELASGHFPITGKSFPDIFFQITEDKEPCLSPEQGYSQELCSFVAQCLTRDIPLRGDTDRLLKMPFIAGDVEPIETFAIYLKELSASAQAKGH
jgi:serine/threonine protein kinase